MDIRRPVWIHRVRTPGAEAFALLFALESVARAVVIALLPIEALRLLGDAQAVSVLFFAVSLGGIAAALGIPLLVRVVGRRWVYTLSTLALVAAPLAMDGDTLVWFSIGLLLRVFAVVGLTVGLSLYIMDHVARPHFTRAEPLRIFYSAGPWIVGPALGTWLATRYGVGATYLLSSIGAAALLAFFWHLRLKDDGVLSHARALAPNPLRYFPRFCRQPRLVFAWVISVGRYVWWVMFFIYVPIYAVESGLGTFAAGLLTSLGTSFLLLLPYFARWVQRLGIRVVLVASFSVSSLLTMAMGVLTDVPLAASALVIGAAFAMVALDAIGNIPFMLSVRRHERSEMTAAYSTYRDVGEVMAPGLFAMVLKFFGLAMVFFLTGALMAALSVLARRAHPRLGLARHRMSKLVLEETPA